MSTHPRHLFILLVSACGVGEEGTPTSSAEPNCEPLDALQDVVPSSSGYASSWCGPIPANGGQVAVELLPCVPEFGKVCGPWLRWMSDDPDLDDLQVRMWGADVQWWRCGEALLGEFRRGVVTARLDIRRGMDSWTHVSVSAHGIGRVVEGIDLDCTADTGDLP